MNILALPPCRCSLYSPHSPNGHCRWCCRYKHLLFYYKLKYYENIFEIFSFCEFQKREIYGKIKVYK